MNDKYGSIICNLNTSIQKNLSVTFNSWFLDQTDSYNISSGGVVIKGGLGISKNVNIGESLTVMNNSNISGNLNVIDNINVSDGVVIKGGLDISKNVNIGEFLTVMNNSNITGNLNVTDNINVSGGVNIGNLQLNSGNIKNTSGTISLDGNINISGNLRFDNINSNSPLIEVGNNATYAYGINIGGFDGATKADRSVIQSSNNLHLDAPTGNNVYLQFYNKGKTITQNIQCNNIYGGEATGELEIHTSSATPTYTTGSTDRNFRYRILDTGTSEGSGLVIDTISTQSTLADSTSTAYRNEQLTFRYYSGGSMLNLGSVGGDWGPSYGNEGNLVFKTCGANNGSGNSGRLMERMRINSAGTITMNRGQFYYYSLDYSDSRQYGQYGIQQNNEYLRTWWRNATRNVECISIDTFGNMGLGVVSPTYQLELSTDKAGKLTTTTWSTTSDMRIKENITSISKEDIYNISKQFNPKKYEYKENFRTAHNLEYKSYIGIIADEVKEYMPCCIEENTLKYKIGENITTDEEGNDVKEDVYEEVENCKRYNGSELQFILFGAIPHLIEENEELNTKYNDVLNKVQELENRVAVLEGN